MFETILVKPIFNILSLIYAIIPGHDFGLSIVLFTIVMRIIVWPLFRKQLHHTKALRELQPELARIKKEAKGDKQKEAAMTMALYKEKEINPFAPIGMLIVQIPILLCLYSAISRIIHNPHSMVDFSYSFIRNIDWMKQLAGDITKFHASFFGLVDLTRTAIKGGLYWPAMMIVIISAVVQYYSSKQLSMTDKETRSLRQILKDTSGSGVQPDQQEVNAAVGRMTRFLIPAMIFFISIRIAAAISLYWLVSGAIALLQQRMVLRSSEMELEASIDNQKVSAEVISAPAKKTKKSSPSKKKRR